MKNTGRVRNVVVTNLKEFEEQLIKSLIHYNISYVKIENEFHFLNRIYRFYDAKLDRNNGIFDIEIVSVLSQVDLLIARKQEDLEKIFERVEPEKFIKVENESSYRDSLIRYNMPTKHGIKKHNQMVNQTIKNKVFTKRTITRRRGN